MSSPSPMAVPTEWITSTQVRTALGLDPADTHDEEWLDLVVAGVNQLVTDTRPSDTETTDPRTTWGALQLATRWYSRRNSSDLSAFVEMGGPPPSIDRDIEVALRIGRYYGPAVA